MLGEYGALVAGNGMMSSIGQLPGELIRFLHTQEGQIAAGIVLLALFLMFSRK